MAFEFQVNIRRNSEAYTYEAYSPQLPVKAYPPCVGSGFTPEDAVRDLLYRINREINMDSIEAIGQYIHYHHAIQSNIRLTSSDQNPRSIDELLQIWGSPGDPFSPEQRLINDFDAAFTDDTSDE